MELQKQVHEISKLMQYKLNKNKFKDCDKMNPNNTGRTWDKLDIKWLLMRLREEADEIEKAIDDKEDPLSIGMECADVCNFAMMIADNVGALDKKI